MAKFLSRNELFKIGILADSDKNGKVYEVAYYYHTKSCMSAKEKVKIEDEDYTVIKPYIERLNECTEEQCVGKIMYPDCVRWNYKIGRGR